MSATINQNEICAENGGKASCVVARNWKAAALLWAVGRKRPDYHVPAPPKRLLEPLNISALFIVARKEVEGSAVVPNIVGYVSVHPLRGVGGPFFTHTR